MSQAPDFKGTYPSAGQYIGPLWQRMWDYMSDGQWVTYWDLADATAADPDQDYVAARATVRNILHQAANTEKVIRRQGIIGKRYTLYRRPIGDPPPIAAGDFVPAPRKNAAAAKVSAVAEREHEVFGVLSRAYRHGLTREQWALRCPEEAEVPVSTARRYINRLIEKGEVLDASRRPVTLKRCAKGMKLFPAPLADDE